MSALLLGVPIDVRSPEAIALAGDVVRRICVSNRSRRFRAPSPMSQLPGDIVTVDEPRERAAMMAIYLELSSLCPQD